MQLESNRKILDKNLFLSQFIAACHTTDVGLNRTPSFSNRINDSNKIMAYRWLIIQVEVICSLKTVQTLCK